MQIALCLANQQKKCMNNFLTSKRSRQYLSARVKTLSPHGTFLVYFPKQRVGQKIARRAQNPSALLRKMPSVAHAIIHLRFLFLEHRGDLR